MNAIVQTGYGSADVMEYRQVDKPAPGSGEVLVRVKAASLGAGEYFGMRGKPLPIRFYIGFPRPKPDFVAGIAFAGIVESAGDGVSDYGPGDEVYGECHGSCAEFAVAEVGSIARKPHNLSFEQSAAVPTSACTALRALRDLPPDASWLAQNGGGIGAQVKRPTFDRRIGSTVVARSGDP